MPARFDVSHVVYTDERSGQQGLFDITRLLLQQPDLAALSETLTRTVQQSALADEAAIILWNAGNHRAARYACDEAGQPVSYEDETVLAHGPVRRLLSRPDALHCDHETFADTGRSLSAAGSIARSGTTRCCRWRPTGGSSAVANFCAVTTGHGARKSSSGCIPSRRSSPSSASRFRTGSATTSITICCATSATTSASGGDHQRGPLASGYRRAGQRGGERDPSLLPDRRHQRELRSNRKGKLNIYSTHYLDASHPVHDQSEVDEAGTLTERVFKSKEMLLLNLHEHDTLAPYEKMLFEMWGNKIQTLCLLPLMSGNTLLGVLKLAQCDEQVFTTTNLKLLRQIAERVSIAIDNALAYREIQRLKERLVDENLALTEQLNNVESEFGRSSAAARR